MTQETLDRRDADPEVIRATLGDLAISNTLFGGRQAVLWGVRQLLRERADTSLTLLDIGAGRGDIARHVSRRFPGMRPLALDHLRTAARMCRAEQLDVVVGDLFHLPIAPRAVDIVVLSQVLHHVPRADIPAFLDTLSRLARVGVVIGDLRRAAMAAAGIWVASHALRFHRVTRVDGVTSVGKGFTRDELAVLCATAGVPAIVTRRPGWRLVAWWPT